MHWDISGRHLGSNALRERSCWIRSVYLGRHFGQGGHFDFPWIHGSNTSGVEQLKVGGFPSGPGDHPTDASGVVITLISCPLSLEVGDEKRFEGELGIRYD